MAVEANGIFTRHWLGDSSSTGTQLRVLTFNILADGLADGTVDAAAVASDNAAAAAMPAVTPDGVAFLSTLEAAAMAPKTFRCMKECLAWKRRWPALRALLLEHSPDLIGLQELDLSEDLSHGGQIFRDLEAAGYKGTAAKKKGRAADGVGLLWRTSRLQEVVQPEIWKLSKSSVHVAVAQRLLLDGETEVLAVATHLKAGLHADAEAERVLQAEGLIGRLRKERSPTIVLADLNSGCRPMADHYGDTLDPKVLDLFAQAGLLSAYSVVVGSEPEYTCWGGWHAYDTAGVFDYVLCSGEQLVPDRVLSLPVAQEVCAFPERLPNALYPSDHFPLVVDFSILPKSISNDGGRGSRSGRGGYGSRGGGYQGRGRHSRHHDDESYTAGSAAAGMGCAGLLRDLSPPAYVAPPALCGGGSAGSAANTVHTVDEWQDKFAALCADGGAASSATGAELCSASATAVKGSAKGGRVGSKML